MLSLTGYGSRLVPRVPFVVWMRPPKIHIQHTEHAVSFGPAGNELGFAPVGSSSVEDVVEEPGMYPNVPLWILHTGQYHFPIVNPVTLYSSGGDWPFELTLEDAQDRGEMLHVRGPLGAPLDLSAAMRGTNVTAEGTVAKHNGTARWSEHTYEHAGAPWRQRLYALALFSVSKLGVEHPFVLTAQAPAGRAESVFALADDIAKGIGSEV
jgi:hypothetical protein